MKIKDTLQFAPYIEAMTKGLTVQSRADSDVDWVDIDEEFIWDACLQYRIKTKPVLRPYYLPEHFIALINKVVQVKIGGLIFRRVGEVKQTNGQWKIAMYGGATYTPEQLFNKYQIVEVVDDVGTIKVTPCGVYVEEVIKPNLKKAGRYDEDTDDEEPEDEGFDEDEDIGDGPDDPEDREVDPE